MLSVFCQLKRLQCSSLVETVIQEEYQGRIPRIPAVAESTSQVVKTLGTARVLRQCWPFSKNVAECRKMKRGESLGFINIHSVAKYQKTRRGDSFETLNKFRKQFRRVPKKIERGDPLVFSGFVGYVKKLKK